MLGFFGFILFLFLPYFSCCSSQEAEVSCALGTDCVLPCSFKVGPYISIHWRKSPGDTQVYSYYNNQDQLQHQHERYGGRTFLFEEISTGNASLLLREVRVDDEGRYVCFSTTSISIVNLKVFEAEVSCAVGTDCVLPCTFRFGPYISIHWRKSPGDTQVHSYYSSRDQLLHQHQNYSLRTFLSDDINRGKASLLLSGVKVQDEGIYMCITSTASDSSISTVNLKVFVPEAEVPCALGTDCVLPCSFNPGRFASIHWKKTPGDTQVHSYVLGQNQFSEQHQNYSKRTFLFENQINTGNASLLLKEVQVHDEGRYLCGTSADSSVTTVNLKVFVSAFVVDVMKQGSELSCRAEGLYPKPEVTWLVDFFYNQAEENTRIQQRQDQLYDISSSVTLRDDVSPWYMCFITTKYSWESTEFHLLEPKTVVDTDAVIHCSHRRTANTRLVWKFNLTETIVTQTGSVLVYGELWRPFVDGITDSNSLVLKGLRQDQQGLYSCHFKRDKNTVIYSTQLLIELKDRQGEVKEANQPESEPNQLSVIFSLCFLILMTIGTNWISNATTPGKIQAHQQSSVVSGKIENNDPLTCEEQLPSDQELETTELCESELIYD